MKLRQFVFRQKLRLDLGLWAIQIVQLVVIVIAAGDKISATIHLPTKVIVLILVPGALFSQWLMGYLLDKAKALELLNRELNKRNELLSRLDEK